jgi:hypothetical protein
MSWFKRKTNKPTEVITSNRALTPEEVQKHLDAWNEALESGAEIRVVHKGDA